MRPLHESDDEYKGLTIFVTPLLFWCFVNGLTDNYLPYVFSHIPSYKQH